jgi:ferric iron reductase protein FhuF
MLDRIGSVRAALARRGGRRADEIELRVAASVLHLGLVARLIAPALAALADQHRLDMRLGELWWQDTLGGPVPLSVPVGDDPGRGENRGENRGRSAEQYCHRLVEDVIAPVTSTLAGLVPVSRRVLWGNVASAVNSAARQVTAQRADPGSPAWTIAAAFLSSPWLARERQPPGPGFRRSSCCLIYRIAADRAGGICGDCIFGSAP